MKNYESFMAPLIHDFLRYREELGYSLVSPRHHLFIFDQYLREKGAEWDDLQPSFFLEMRANLKAEPRSVNRILTTLRTFFHYLIRLDYLDENPLRHIPSLRENTIIPFIFSPQQVDQLLEVTYKGIRKGEGLFLKDLTLYNALLLLARCGLRISEPLKLLIHHYRPDDGTIYIEKTKFQKNRLIPIPLEAMREMKNYLSVRRTLVPQDQNPYLLAGNDQKPLTENQVRFLFHKVLKRIGIEQKRQVIGNVNISQPTPHSMRHSFAVNTLNSLKARGESMGRALPLLAAYMGHSHYKYTSLYLKVADAISRKNLVDFTLWQKRDK
jgi:site-specific recombinase XerD